MPLPPGQAAGFQREHPCLRYLCSVTASLFPPQVTQYVIKRFYTLKSRPTDPESNLAGPEINLVSWDQNREHQERGPPRRVRFCELCFAFTCQQLMHFTGGMTGEKEKISSGWRQEAPHLSGTLHPAGRHTPLRQTRGADRMPSPTTSSSAPSPPRPDSRTLAPSTSVQPQV